MNTMKRLRKAVWLQRAILAVLMPGMMLMQDVVMANPTGGVVVHGNIAFEGLDTANLRITQGSDKAIINWQDFSIGKGEITEFIQPGKNSAVLNRVVSGNPSAIFGTLKANGGVMVVNTNGILVGAGGVIDVVGNLTLSTLDIDNNDFLNGGDNRFRGNSSAGVTNFGTINSSEGDVILLGNFVENNGSIGALNGQVALGAGGDIIVHETGDAKITVKAGGVGGGTGITNTGTIEGAAVELKAHGNVYALAINNSGAIRATGSQRINGRVILSAGEPGGDITNTGTIEATNGANGGEILIDGGQAGVIDLRTGKVSANGSNKGGSVTVLGSEINVGPEAEVTADGKAEGGSVIIGSPETNSVNIDGNVSASGGTRGGTVGVFGSTVDVAGNISATGGSYGGAVKILGDTVTQAAGSQINVGGANAAGSIFVNGVDQAVIGGSLSANSSRGYGGNVTVTGADLLARSTATMESVGAFGGAVRFGGDFQGNDDFGLQESDLTTVEEGASIIVDGTTGDAGLVVVWSNKDTIYNGEISASARGPEGNGGLIEVSGKENLFMQGGVIATSVGGEAGTVLFDPGDIEVGNFGATPGANQVNIAAINQILQGGTSLILATQSGSIFFNSVGEGGWDQSGADNAVYNQGTVYDYDPDNPRNLAIQWTNSSASFGAFASGAIFVNNHIRTSGRGSINLMAGWTGTEGEINSLLFENVFTANALDSVAGPRIFDDSTAPITATTGVSDIFDYYLENGQFGQPGGALFVGNSTMTRHVEVGSRFGTTNIAAENVFVRGSDNNNFNRYAQIGFKDDGGVFGLRLNNGGGRSLDLTNAAGQWYLSDGINNGGAINNGEAGVNGVFDPIAAIVGMNEVDINGDGIADGVWGVNSSGVLDGSSNGQTAGDATFIPYASHFNSVAHGNWWWQQIEDAGSKEVKDPTGLGALRPENGAGAEFLTADINVVATGTVDVRAGDGRDANYAMIGHGGFSQSWGGSSRSTRETGNVDPNNGSFGDAGIEQGQLERRWTINGSTNDRSATSIGRLAPVYGNINVLAGVNTDEDITINRTLGTISATVDDGGNVILTGGEFGNYQTGNQSSNSFAQIGHGGIAQFGQYIGDIYVEAAGRVDVLAGTATRTHAAIGHTNDGYSYFNATNNVDQQVRFFATSLDMRNPNMRRGELFSGVNTTGFTTLLDPVEAAGNRDITVADLMDEEIQNPRGSGATQENAGNPDPGNLIDLQYPDDRGTINETAIGPVTVSALDGSVVSGFHGDVTVVANGGSVTVTAGNSPADDTAQTRDRRFAAIGHGGSNFGHAVDGAGYNGSNLGAPFDSGEDREVVNFRSENGDNAQTGSRAVIGSIGPVDLDRSVTFMTITGNVDVQSAANVSVIAGNDIYDNARIGHGGNDLADIETSSFILGDIRVTAGGSVLVEGGGRVSHESNRNNFDMRAQAQIGHGGYQSGFFDFTGDIEVTADLNVTVTGGAYRWNYGQIGHGGVQNYAQVGGDFVRDENYLRDGISIDIDSSVDSSGASVIYTYADNPLSTGMEVSPAGTLLFNSGEGDLVTAGESGINTSNVIVTTINGDVIMNHLEEGRNRNQKQVAAGRTEGSRTGQAWSLIGHGGNGEDAFNENNNATDYGDKNAKIFVTSGNDILMQNGQGGSNGGQTWTRIGHGLTTGAGNDRNGIDALELVGDITVYAEGDITLDASAGGAIYGDDPNDTDPSDGIDQIVIAQQRNGVNGGTLNDGGIIPIGPPVELSPVVIGHGGLTNNRDLVVLSNGEEINGIEASSDISVTARGNMTIQGGAGSGTQANVFRGSWAQVGHGFSTNGDDRALRNAIPTGFNGDITVVVDGDLSVLANNLAGSQQGLATAGVYEGVNHGFAAIGNGGVGLDAPATGDISVFVGNDLLLQGQQRWQGVLTPVSGTGNTAGGGNFAKIGHVGFEDSLFTTNNANDRVVNSDHTGDITVVVTNDLTMQGGTVPVDLLTTGTSGAFVQIGHGGPAITGDLDGDILVLVGNDLNTASGSGRGTGDTTAPGNNYAMIGNGDWIKDGVDPFIANFADGTRRGDVEVAVGRNANFVETLVGHADRRIQNSSAINASGSTRVAASRNFPFYDILATAGPLNGGLTATTSSVFSSGGYGSSGNLEFYIPQRSLNFIDNTTRLNEAVATYEPITTDFADSPIADGGVFDPTMEEFAGRNDEIYLTPDLWWDNTGLSTLPGSSPFPTSLAEVQGGSISDVDAPGGLPNLVANNAGDFGDSGAGFYQAGNGVSGGGQYTFFYDAIQPVGTTPTPVPVPPGVFVPEVEEPVVIPIFIPFDFYPFLFLDKFDSFDRDDMGLDGLTGDENGLLAALGLFESEEDQDESEVTDAERALDNLFGDRKDEDEEGEQDEERQRKRERNSRAVGNIGLVFYTFDPQGNRYSSHRVFGVNQTIFPPAQ